MLDRQVDVVDRQELDAAGADQDSRRKHSDVGGAAGRGPDGREASYGRGGGGDGLGLVCGVVDCRVGGT